ncbi:MAG: HlyD family efflux transporter periplasmic adaptor subunit [Planctomycetes bacterium]|nr:HlyD family efflux transporter periplasmic adaptor subunit [Planctomycetota bacterium]
MSAPNGELQHAAHQHAAPSVARVSSRLPRPRHWSSKRKILTFGALGLLAVALLAIGLGLARGLFGHAPFTGPTWAVRKEILKVTIVARGNLESAKNGDITCTVRSGTKGSMSATSIKWIVDNGAEVNKGDKVIELDDSGLQEQLKTQNRVVDEAKADQVKADEQYRIDEIQSQSDIEKAVNARDLAKLDLEKYVDGDFIQALKDVEGRIETSKSDLETWKDRAAWSKRMAKKGLMSKVQADADESRMDGARIALQKVDEEKRVLVDYTKKRTIQDLTAKLAEAERALEKTKIQTKALIAQDEAQRQSKRSVFEQELSKKKEIQGEIGKCIVLAPQDGLVVYYVPEQVRGGGGSQQSIVAQGEPVREGQKMMQIPDLSHMLVNVRVPEAMVSYLHSEEDPKDKSTWQLAQVKIDAFSSRVLQGHIKLVDTVASQQDWFAADVKVYKTIISIDTPMDGLKPGMSAEVTLFADESATPVLVVPVQAVLGTISMGADRKCFVVGPDRQPVMRDIVVGMCNERLVEIKSGLREGEEVVLNPRPLLKDDSELKPGKVRSKNEDEGSSNGENGKKGKKKGAGKGPDSPGSNGPPSAAGPSAGKEGGPSAQQMQAFTEQMRNGTPEQRRDFLNRIPEGPGREKARQWLKDQKLEVAN